MVDRVRSSWAVEPGLQTLIRGVGDYLMRVVGSVPNRFRLTAQSRRGERRLNGLVYYYDTVIAGFLETLLLHKTNANCAGT